jgi:hypothetical protein
MPMVKNSVCISYTTTSGVVQQALDLVMSKLQDPRIVFSVFIKPPCSQAGGMVLRLSQFCERLFFFSSIFWERPADEGLIPVTIHTALFLYQWTVIE